MASVVFLRGVNVGGAKRFQPALLAKELKGLEGAVDVLNVGAAGTFVVRGKVAERALRAEVAKRLAFEADVMVCKAAEVLALVEAPPFGPLPADAKAFVSVLGGKPSKAAKLPLERPSGEWEVRVVAVEGPFAVSLRRNRVGRFYPNEIVEKELGVRATTRGWDTMLKVAKALRPAPA